MGDTEHKYTLVSLLSVEYSLRNYLDTVNEIMEV